MCDRSHLKSLEEYAGEIADLIKKGDEARDKARLPHDHSAGAHLAEARLKMSHPKFVQWVEREFDISGSRAYELIALAAIKPKQTSTN
jgi:hypothetical protein